MTDSNKTTQEAIECPLCQGEGTIRDRPGDDYSLEKVCTLCDGEEVIWQDEVSEGVHTYVVDDDEYPEVGEELDY